jgi:hypothetical protein
VSDINTAVVDSLKVLDPNRPIREVDIPTARFRRDSESLLADHRVIVLSDRLTTNQFGVVGNPPRAPKPLQPRLMFSDRLSGQIKALSRSNQFSLSNVTLFVIVRTGLPS